MIFGTDGHIDAGTREKLTPNTKMVTKAKVLLGNAGNTNAKILWQTTMIIAPTIIIDAPLPL